MTSFEVDESTFADIDIVGEFVMLSEVTCFCKEVIIMFILESKLLSDEADAEAEEAAEAKACPPIFGVFFLAFRFISAVCSLMLSVNMRETTPIPSSFPFIVRSSR
ncbi:protein of unknown function [Paenibacillus alvei]|uniref:Uncharacterized protein n=1 Tax=Paenibacillus alvei TaxID=44250 RepID=A0A383RG02_PAEAL|nr:protein of unknown function [Paenibacillus alvei]